MNKDTRAIFSNRWKYAVLTTVLILVILSTFYVLTLGNYTLSINEVYGVFWRKFGWLTLSQGSDQMADLLVMQVRLPRILMAILVGMGLAVSGAIFQSCFTNPLVEPYILGVSGGAAFGASLAIVFPLFLFGVQIGSFTFGALAVLLAYGLARVRGRTSIVSLILSGVIIGSLFTALVSMLKYLSDDAALKEIVFWLLGRFYNSSWKDVYMVAPAVIFPFIYAWSKGWTLNVLTMGDDEARSLGIHPQRNKLVLILLATLMTTISVSSVGIIAWVGLMVPHASRMIIGPDNRFVIPLSAGLGALYMLWCDTIARTLLQIEIPVGIITSLLGAPYLIYLLRSKTSGFTAY